MREENSERGEQGERRTRKKENKEKGEQGKRRTGKEENKEKEASVLEHEKTEQPVPVHQPYNTSVASSATMEICRLGTLSLSWDASADNTCEKKERTRKSGVRD